MLRRLRTLVPAALICGASLVGFVLLYLLSRTSPRRA
jgi:hypothetical protein